MMVASCSQNMRSNPGYIIRNYFNYCKDTDDWRVFVQNRGQPTVSSMCEFGAFIQTDAGQSRETSSQEFFRCQTIIAFCVFELVLLIVIKINNKWHGVSSFKKGSILTEFLKQRGFRVSPLPWQLLHPNPGWLGPVQLWNWRAFRDSWRSQTASHLSVYLIKHRHTV